MKLTDKEQGTELSALAKSIGPMHVSGTLYGGIFWHNTGYKGSTATLKGNTYVIMYLFKHFTYKITRLMPWM